MHANGCVCPYSRTCASRKKDDSDARTYHGSQAFRWRGAANGGEVLEARAAVEEHSVRRREPANPEAGRAQGLGNPTQGYGVGIARLDDDTSVRKQVQMFQQRNTQVHDKNKAAKN